MTHARIISHGQERWHHDVLHITAQDNYITLHLAYHPSRVHYWLGAKDTSVLLCATDEDVTAALREEIA